jgi:Rieske 2Fe-2S family protein
MTNVDRMRSLFAERRTGHSLPQALYADPAALEFDIQAIFNRYWLQAGLEIEIPKAGDYITMTVGVSPIVILRNEEGGVSAFFNSCRHRGAQICTEERGHMHRLVCPYHQWTYDLTGQLLRAGRMQEDFDVKAFRLRQVHTECVAGLIFISLTENAPDFTPIRAALEPLLAPHDLRNGKVAYTATLIERANWKLVMENARECYHCRARHLQLMHSFRDFTTQDLYSAPEPWMVEFWARCAARGLKNGPIRGSDFEAGRFALSDGVVSVTADGKRAVAKTLGAMGDGDVGTMWWALQPNCFNHAVGDYAFLFQALPTGPQETVVTAKWVVNKDAVEGVDYDLARLTEVWNATNNEDRWLAENNQRGVNSIAYVPGPYSQISEGRVLRFVDWYCAASEAFIANGGYHASRPMGFRTDPSQQRSANVG